MDYKFGERLKEARQKRGYTLQDVVELYSKTYSQYGTLSRGTLSKYENGKQEPMISVVNRLSKILDVSVDYILGENDDILKRSNRPPNVFPIHPTKTIPLIGNIACGIPILAIDNIDKNISVDATVQADFALRFKGDSMINARINDGDIVYIHQQDDVDNGDIAAVLIDGEVALKRVYKTAAGVVLQPENNAYAPMVYTEQSYKNIRIIGKAVAFLSSIR